MTESERYQDVRAAESAIKHAAKSITKSTQSGRSEIVVGDPDVVRRIGGTDVAHRLGL